MKMNIKDLLRAIDDAIEQPDESEGIKLGDLDHIINDVTGIRAINHARDCEKNNSKVRKVIVEILDDIETKFKKEGINPSVGHLSIILNTISAMKHNHSDTFINKVVSSPVKELLDRKTCYEEAKSENNPSTEH